MHKAWSREREKRAEVIAHSEAVKFISELWLESGEKGEKGKEKSFKTRFEVKLLSDLVTRTLASTPSCTLLA